MPEPWWPASAADRPAAEHSLLEAEHEVTLAVEALAARRRALPDGSPVRDYAFVEGPRDVEGGDQPELVNLRQLFGEHSTLLL